MPRLTVLLSSYNRPRGLKRAIQSVLDQTLSDLELLVLDDGSTLSAVRKVLDEATGADKRVSCLQVQQRWDKAKTCTFGALLNMGLKITDSQYVSYLCDNVEMLPKRCERLVAHLGEHRDLDLAWDHQNVRYEDANGDVVRQEIRDERPEAFERWQGFGWARRLQASNCVDHNGVVEVRGMGARPWPWSEKVEDWNRLDWERWLRLAELGVAFGFLPYVGEVKHVGPDSTGVQIARGATLAQVIADRGKS